MRAFGALLGPGIDFGDLYFQHRARELDARGRHRQGRRAFDRAGRRRARDLRREDRASRIRTRSMLPALLEAAQSARAIARDGSRRSSRSAACRCDGRALYPRDRSDRSARQRSDKVAAAAQRSTACCARTRSARAAGDGRARRRRRHRAGRAQRRHARRRRAAAGAPQRAGDRRAERPPRTGLCRRRRALLVCRTARPTAAAQALAREAVRQALVNLEAVAAPAGTMPVVLGTGLAGRAAARGDRPRPRRRLQPQGHVGVRRPHRRARRVAGRAPSSTTARCRGGAARSTSTTKARRPAARR